MEVHSIFLLSPSVHVLDKTVIGFIFISNLFLPSYTDSDIMPGNFTGKWKTCKSEGWDTLLGKFGVPVDKFPTDIVVTEEITQSGDTITVKYSNNKGSNVREVTFNVGSNFKYEVVPGVELDFATAWEGNKLVLTRTTGEGRIVREIVGANMIVNLNHEGILAKSTYEKA